MIDAYYFSAGLSKKIINRGGLFIKALLNYEKTYKRLSQAYQKYNDNTSARNKRRDAGKILFELATITYGSFKAGSSLQGSQALDELSLIAPKATGRLQTFADDVAESGVWGIGNRIRESAGKYGFKHADDTRRFVRGLAKSPDNNFSYILHPRGPGASSVLVPGGYTKVSRWIGEGEVKHWFKGGGTRIPPEVDNASRIHVTRFGESHPGSGVGLNRVDFYVPDNILQQGGNSGWYAIFQPNQNTPIYNVEIFLHE